MNAELALDRWTAEMEAAREERKESERNAARWLAWERNVSHQALLREFGDMTLEELFS